MSDVVERLRSEIPPGRAWCREAADEIERLQQENQFWDNLHRDVRAATIEECAMAARAAHSRAHTYASENADVYIAADRAVEKVIAAIRALKEQK